MNKILITIALIATVAISATSCNKGCSCSQYKKSEYLVNPTGRDSLIRNIFTSTTKNKKCSGLISDMEETWPDEQYTFTCTDW